MEGIDLAVRKFKATFTQMPHNSLQSVCFLNSSLDFGQNWLDFASRSLNGKAGGWLGKVVERVIVDCRSTSTARCPCLFLKLRNTRPKTAFFPLHCVNYLFKGLSLRRKKR